MDLTEARRHARATEHVLRLHEATCPARRQPPPQPGARMPFAADRIHPDTLTEIAERMSTEGLTLYAAADEYGHPVELLERELAAYAGRYRQEILSRSAWRQRRS